MAEVGVLVGFHDLAGPSAGLFHAQELPPVDPDDAEGQDVVQPLIQQAFQPLCSGAGVACAYARAGEWRDRWDDYDCDRVRFGHGRSGYVLRVDDWNDDWDNDNWYGGWYGGYRGGDFGWYNGGHNWYRGGISTVIFGR